MLYTVFDIETTGLGSGWTEDVLQFAYAQLNERTEIVRSGNFYLYYEGQKHNQEVADKIHKLYPAFLRQYADNYIKYLDEMYIVTQKGNLVGHNIDRFDIPFFNAYMKRKGYPEITPVSTLDTLKLIKPLKIGSNSLDNVLSYFGITEDDVTSYERELFGTAHEHHNAAWDVAATVLIFRFEKIYKLW